MLTSPLYFGFSSQYTLNLTHIRSRPGSRSEPESEPKSKSEYQPGSGSRQCEAVVRRGVLLLRLLDHVAFVDDRASLQPLANLAALPLQLQRATTAAAPRGGQPKARVRHEGCNPYQGCNPITRDTPQRTRDTTLRTRAATLCECTSDAPRELAALRRQQERQREACGAPSRHAAQPVLDRALPGKVGSIRTAIMGEQTGATPHLCTHRASQCSGSELGASSRNCVACTILTRSTTGRAAALRQSGANVVAAGGRGDARRSSNRHSRSQPAQQHGRPSRRSEHTRCRRRRLRLSLHRRWPSFHRRRPFLRRFRPSLRRRRGKQVSK